MQTAAQPVQEDVHSFIQEYFDIWKGTDIDKIMAYYTDDVSITLPTGTLEGNTAVRDSFVKPFVSAFPGNVHSIQNLAVAPAFVAVEWNFDAEHKGEFAGVPASGKKVHVSGCSFYYYNLATRKISAGRVYFDISTLLREMGAGI
jgi:steroid delta-isomerase-like uncharacterized protein